MKRWRPQLIALVILLAFIGFSYSYVRYFVRARTHAVIVFLVAGASQELLALVARYHRKSAPSPRHQRYLNLESFRREHLRWLAGILRVADAMDRSHSQKLLFDKLTLRPGVCLIFARGEGVEEANFGLERKADLFQQVSGRQPLLKTDPS